MPRITPRPSYPPSSGASYLPNNGSFAGASAGGAQWLFFDSYDDATNDGKSVVFGVDNGSGASTHVFPIFNGLGNNYFLQYVAANTPAINAAGGYISQASTHYHQYPFNAAEITAGLVYYFDVEYDAAISFMLWSFGTAFNSLTTSGCVRVSFDMASGNVRVFQQGGSTFYNAAYSYAAGSNQFYFYISDDATPNITLYDSALNVITGPHTLSGALPSVYMANQTPGTGRINAEGAILTTDPTSVVLP